MLKGKKILIGITGSIAAYKIPILIRLLKKEGAEVRVVMTPSAKDFVTSLTLATLSENPVEGGFFNHETGAWRSHVELGLWADLFIIAPATANTLAKMYVGIADNYLLTVYLSSRCKVMFAPAMDLDMFQHPATKNTIQGLVNRGNLLIEPAFGELASGLCGEGRLEEPEVIFDLIKTFFTKKKRFEGKIVLVSAGPTHEAIDPVRYISNHSSGLMGISIADAFAAEGAEVKLILGPTHLQPNNKNVEVIAVGNADEMYKYCQMLFSASDITVMTAAVADFKPANVAKLKIKKKDPTLALQLVPTKDILLELGKTKNKNQLLIGFALETNDEKKYALEKLHKKNLDLIVLNRLEEPGAGFGHDTNKVSFFDKNGKEEHFELKQKTAVAADLVNRVYSMLTTEK
jgi:phosphopantothenoylcysteine decarboxylase / phosphopantothenate---cysteine ligase